MATALFSDQCLPGDDGGGEMWAGHQGPAQLLIDDAQVHQRPARAAEGLGVGEAQPVETGHLLPQGGKVAQVVLFELSDRGQGAAGLEQLSGDPAQFLMAVVERGVHGYVVSGPLTGAGPARGWPAPFA